MVGKKWTIKEELNQRYHPLHHHHLQIEQLQLVSQLILQVKEI